jgi:hypothetical protein
MHRMRKGTRLIMTCSMSLEAQWYSFIASDSKGGLVQDAVHLLITMKSADETWLRHPRIFARTNLDDLQKRVQFALVFAQLSIVQVFNDVRLHESKPIRPPQGAIVSRSAQHRNDTRVPVAKMAGPTPRMIKPTAPAAQNAAYVISSGIRLGFLISLMEGEVDNVPQVAVGQRICRRGHDHHT